MSRYYQNWEDIGRKPKSSRSNYSNQQSYNYADNRKVYGPSKTHAIFLIKALVITIIILVLSSPNINIISSLNSQLNASALQSLAVLVNFLVIFFATLIYDHVTSKGRFFLQEVFSSLFASLLLILGSPFQPVLFALFFLLLLSGYILGKTLEEFAEYHGKRVFVSGTVTFLIFIWIFYIIFSAFNTTNANGGISNGVIALFVNLVNVLKSGNLATLQSSAISTCVSQVNQYASIGVQKQPQVDGSSESTSIQNTTVFTKYSQINPWIVQWASVPSTSLFSFQQTSGVNCNQGSSTYICKDLQILNQSASTTQNFTAIGVILEVSVTQPLIITSGTETTNYLLPTLCNSTGYLLPNSKYYISH